MFLSIFIFSNYLYSKDGKVYVIKKQEFQEIDRWYAGYLKKAIDNKENIEDMFNYFDIKKGDAFYIPSGCIHAILGNVIIAEIQTPSDVTYRLYDWNRVDKNGKSRELHIEDSFNVIKNILDLGYPLKNIICMQGPFSKDMNTATLKHIKAEFLVTKDTGKTGGFDEKLEAAKSAGAELIVIGRPEEKSKGYTFEELKKIMLEEYL